VKVAAVGDSFFVGLFTLVGVEGTAVNTPEEAAAAVEECVARGDVGVVLVSQTLAERAGDALSAFFRRTSPPFVVSLPDRDAERDNVEDLVEGLGKLLGIRL